MTAWFNSFTKLLLLLLTLQISIAWAKKPLDLSNLNSEVQTEILKRFPIVQKEKLTLEQIDDLIRFLHAKFQFENVRVWDDGGSTPYRLEFKKTRRIGSIKILGLKSLSRAEAENFFSIRSNDVFDPQGIAEAGERIRLAYKDRGFLNAKLDIEMPARSDEIVDVKIQVTENQPTLIKDIILQSSNEDLNSKIVKELKKFLNSPLTESTLSAIQVQVRDYLRKNSYVRTSIGAPTTEFNKDESEANLTYKLEKTEKYSFTFQGVLFLGVRDIERTLDLENFYSGSPAIGEELAQKIRSYYLSKGYARVQVKSFEDDGKGPFRKHLIFEIEEGPRVKIKEISIIGSFSKKASYYINFIKGHSSKLIKDGLYNKEDIEVGLRNLLLELQNDGYLQAKVISTRTQYNKDKNEINLNINLDEGPLTVIEDIEFIGNREFLKEQLLEATGLQVGPLKLKKVEQAIAALKDYYQEQGYIEMLLLNEKSELVKYDESNTRASLSFQILEGAQVKAASILIEGNAFTRDYVIQQELELKVGELVTPKKIEESIARLQRTGFFNSVDIRTLEEKTNVSNRTVIVKVSEREPGLFNLGVGATNERTLTIRGYTGISYRNLLGTGRGIALRVEGNYNVADIKYLERRIVLGYIEPYIFSTRFRGRVNITRSTSVSDYELRQASEINSTTYSLEKDFTSHILGVWDLWSLATIRDFGIDERYPFPTNTQEIASTGPTLDIDFRDNPFNPTQGTFTRWSAEYSSPQIGSTITDAFSIEYWRTTLNFTHYLKAGLLFNQPIIWANQIRGGYLKNLSEKPAGGVPWDKKGFTLGGQSTIRGFEAGTQEVFPNREDLKLSDTDRAYNLTTEASMYLIKSEVRFPIHESLGAALFYDGGSVEIKGLTFSDSYRDSAGFGIRYNTPVGPLSLDWAWKLDAQPREEPWRFHLSIGSF
jgi:outer membrane protein insertion porin family